MSGNCEVATKEYYDMIHVDKKQLLIVHIFSQGFFLQGIDTYKIIDRMAEEHGHEVLRLPPYHSGLLNPIEQMWGLVKIYIARHNTFQRMSDVSKVIICNKIRLLCMLIIYF